jgi:SAM-dependent methyltransferase
MSEEFSQYRSRGIDIFTDRCGDITKDIKKLLKNKEKIKVLELGPGYGKVLLELKQIFGDKIETYGITHQKEWSEKKIKKFALANKMFSKADVDNNIPQIYFQDLNYNLKLPSNKFDIIFSQSSFQHVSSKALALEETHRLLTKDGIARIHLQPGNDEHIRTKLGPLFDIWDGKGGRMYFHKYAKRFKNITPLRKGFKITKTKNFDLKLKKLRSLHIKKLDDSKTGVQTIYIITSSD